MDCFRRLRLEALSREGGETECQPGNPEGPGLVEDIGNDVMILELKHVFYSRKGNSMLITLVWSIIEHSAGS